MIISGACVGLYRSLVHETDPYLSRHQIDILLPEYTHQETELFKLFIYTGELRWGATILDLKDAWFIQMRKPETGFFLLWS